MGRVRIGKLNLTWWRKRPSVHVADYPDTKVVNFTQIISMLDPDRTQFTTLLMGPKTITVKQPVAVGSYIAQMDDFIYRVESCKRVLSDDWFQADQWELVLRKPYTSPQPAHHWLEDDFIPRLGV